MRNIKFSQFLRSYRKHIALYFAMLAALILLRDSQFLQAFDNVVLLTAFGAMIWAGSKLYLAIPRRTWNRAFDAFVAYCNSLTDESDTMIRETFTPTRR